MDIAGCDPVEQSIACRHYAEVPTPSKHMHSPPLVALGAALRALRKEKGLSQEALSEAVRMDRSYLGAVERGENIVSLIALIEVARALETSVERIMRDASL